MSSDIVLAPRVLSENGKCCGRKPLFYKTARGMRSMPDPHYFCCRCCAEFTPDGAQRSNWGYLAVPGGFSPAYPEQDYWQRPTPSPERTEA